MKNDYTNVKNIYIVCGKTDMRKGIDGLATLVQDVYELDPYEDAIFLFSGRCKDRFSHRGNPKGTQNEEQAFRP